MVYIHIYEIVHTCFANVNFLIKKSTKMRINHPFEIEPSPAVKKSNNEGKILCFLKYFIYYCLGIFFYLQIKCTQIFQKSICIQKLSLVPFSTRDFSALLLFSFVCESAFTHVWASPNEKTRTRPNVSRAGRGRRHGVELALVIRPPLPRIWTDS